MSNHLLLRDFHLHGIQTMQSRLIIPIRGGSEILNLPHSQPTHPSDPPLRVGAINL